ncbi:GNAT family N-acetyltransferase [Streptomyces sp. NPDC047072]|uniref:GNAT family N-acetyltransferase n=1 Tax=Streptomyces sp. NPDC047072 TaxID=3154809 RepID=UPI0033ED126B
MPRLITPEPRFRTSFLDAVRENLAEGGRVGDILAWELREYGDTWDEPEGFARYVRAAREQAAEEEGYRSAGFVPVSWYWYVDGDHYIGRIQVRHRLTPHLRDYGGHIGYGVRPTARRRGHATAMLREALPHARALGLGRVLVTCDVVNIGSRKVIEANGGVLEDERGGKLRYWIRTGN